MQTRPEEASGASASGTGSPLSGSFRPSPPTQRLGGVSGEGPRALVSMAGGLTQVPAALVPEAGFSESFTAGLLLD